MLYNKSLLRGDGDQCLLVVITSNPAWRQRPGVDIGVRVHRSSVLEVKLVHDDVVLYGLRERCEYDGGIRTPFRIDSIYGTAPAGVSGRDHPRKPPRFARLGNTTSTLIGFRKLNL
jgi:hypothetical protein